MGSPLGPVLAGIFMAELETRIIPTVTDNISHWRRYVDDTFVFIRKGCVEHVLARLNSFHKNIQFTYELENQNKLPFLDVLLIRRGNKIETTVYRKSTNNDIYLNWGSFAPVTWKRGTLKTLFNRAYIVCSTDYHLKEELEDLRYVFQKHNNYTKWMMKQVAKQVKDQNIQSNADGGSSNKLPSNSKSFTLLLPYTGQKGEHLTRSLRKDMHRTLPENFQTRIFYTGTKLGTKFNNIKDPVKKSHQHDVVYYTTCPEPGCVEDYIGETGRPLNERVIDHNGRDKMSHLYKHSQESNHACVSLSDFKIIDSNFQNQKFKRKIVESLLIRETQSSLNTQEMSIPLKLFI